MSHEEVSTITSLIFFRRHFCVFCSQNPDERMWKKTEISREK